MAFLKVAMLKLLFEFDVVTFAQEIMSVQGQLTLSTYPSRHILFLTLMSYWF